MCFDTACLLVSKCSARAFGVIACKAIRLNIARLVGSAIAWNTSRLIYRVILKLATNRLQIYVQLFGFTNFFLKLFCPAAKKPGQKPLCSQLGLPLTFSMGKHIIFFEATTKKLENNLLPVALRLLNPLSQTEGVNCLMLMALVLVAHKNKLLYIYFQHGQQN